MRGDGAMYRGEIVLHRLIGGARAAEGLAVIIDVFRAFSLECVLYGLGAREVRPVGTVEEARAWRDRDPDCLLAGERKGVMCEGFDFGNSPSALRAEAVAGRRVIHTTSAGTQGLVNAVRADAILTGSLLNARAIAEYIRRTDPPKVSLVCMGRYGATPAEEDELCALYLRSLLLEQPRPDLAARLDRAFERWGVLCRETAAAEEMSFGEALTLLRRMEYTGEARRGYFVRGLSGAQFVRAKDFERISERLRQPDGDCLCLCAADPAQAWGRILPLDRAGDSAFLCVPGTVVVLEAGQVALIVERQGAALRSPRGSEAAVMALAAAFRAGKIYPHLRILTVREYPADIAPWLQKAGFIREMRDYVLTADR